MSKNYWAILLEEIARCASASNSKFNKSNKKRRDIKMYYLGEKFKDIYFSKREADCMCHLLSGKSFNGIAENLNLSPRTIEFYIKNMKKKVDCHTKFELIELVMGSDFLANYKEQNNK